MCWEQINGDHWIIPETKNGKSHTVTLHSLAGQKTGHNLTDRGRLGIKAYWDRLLIST